MTSAARQPGTALDHAASPLAGAFNREWRRSYERRPPPDRWRTDECLARFGCMADVLAAVENPGEAPDSAEPILTRLTELAATGDEDAARVLLQYLLPFLVRVSFRRAYLGQQAREEALDGLLSVAWEAVTTGVDLRGRPVKIALLRTIEPRALRQPARVARRLAEREVLFGDPSDVMSASQWLVDGQGRSVSATASAGEQVIRLLAEARRKGLTDRDAQLIAALFVGGSTCEVIAATEGVTDRAIRFRRAAAIRRLAEVAA